MIKLLFGKEKSRNVELQKKTRVLEKKLSLAISYLSSISNGNFDLDLHSLDHSLTGEDGRPFINTLGKTKEKLLEYSRKEKEQVWMAEGLSKFMSLIRGDTRRSDFYDKIIALLVTYTEANQGGIFLLNDKNPGDHFLEMSTCYAYGKKRFKEKRIEIGQGLLGQCFLEKSTAVYTKIPSNYVEITSGLGEATPGFLLIIPIHYNDEVLGVMELASFQMMDKCKIEFLERVAENLASVRLNLKNAEQVEQLYNESQTKAKKLQEQEENLRQNLEELVATQEEMKRHQRELGQQTSFLKFILDNIPFPVFVKDEKGRYALVNKAEAKLFNLHDKELIGRDDSSFVATEDEWKVIKETDDKVLQSDQPIELPLQHFTTTQGSSYIFKTTKIPFINNVTGKKNILGVSLDLTEKLNLEKKLFHEKQISNNNVLNNIAGRQRMLSQKIGFYCETVWRGKKQHIGLLKEAIALHDHSLQVIQHGGIPMGLMSDDLLPTAEDLLIPYIEKVKQVWSAYKTAADKIVYYATLTNHFPESEKQSAIEKNLNFIENNSEILLTLNDDLMKACIQINQEKLLYSTSSSMSSMP